MNEIKDNESICVECDKKINDDMETKWDLYSDPLCNKCYNEKKWTLREFLFFFILCSLFLV